MDSDSSRGDRIVINVLRYEGSQKRQQKTRRAFVSVCTVHKCRNAVQLGSKPTKRCDSKFTRHPSPVNFDHHLFPCTLLSNLWTDWNIVKRVEEYKIRVISFRSEHCCRLFLRHERNANHKVDASWSKLVNLWNHLTCIFSWLPSISEENSIF